MLYLLVNRFSTWLIDHGLYGGLQLLEQLQFRALAAAFLAFAIVLLAGRPTIRWLTRQKIGDTGSTDAEALRSPMSSQANTPTMGGLLVAGSVFLGCFSPAGVASCSSSARSS